MTATWSGIGYAADPADYGLRAKLAAQKLANEIFYGVPATDSVYGGAAGLLGGGTRGSDRIPGQSVLSSTEGQLAADVLAKALGIQGGTRNALGVDNPDFYNQVKAALGNDPSRLGAALTAYEQANPGALEKMYGEAGQAAIEERAKPSLASILGPLVVGGLAAAGAGGLLPSFGSPGSLGINIGGQAIGNTASLLGGAAPAAAGGLAPVSTPSMNPANVVPGLNPGNTSAIIPSSIVDNALTDALPGLFSPVPAGLGTGVGPLAGGAFAGVGPLLPPYLSAVTPPGLLPPTGGAPVQTGPTRPPIGGPNFGAPPTTFFEGLKDLIGSVSVSPTSVTNIADLLGGGEDVAAADELGGGLLASGAPSFVPSPYEGSPYPAPLRRKRFGLLGL